MRRRDPQIAGSRDFEPRTDTDTVDAGDHRHREVADSGIRLTQQGQKRPRLRGRELLQFLQIGTAEKTPLAFARKDGEAEIVVVHQTEEGIAQLSHDLPGLYTLDARVGFENAEYDNGREDDFLRLGLSVSRPVILAQDLNGSVSVFYNYNENESSEVLSSFDQTLAGVRFGFVY